MRYNIIFFITILSFILSSKAYGNTTFYFNVTEEGVYTFKIPDRLVDKELFISFKNHYYKVYTENNYGYVYCPNKGCYQISNNYEKSLRSFSVSSVLKIDERNHYKYSLPNSLNNSHWFLDIISEDKPFKKKIYKGRSVNKKKEHVKLKLYNFKKSKAPIVIRIDGKEHHRTIPYGDYQLSVPVISEKKYFEIEVSSFFHEVGIENIEIESFKDRKILHENDFEKYVFSSSIIIERFKPNYAYGTFNNNAFKKVEKGIGIKNLILQKASSISEVKLHASITPNTTYKDFLVVYNSRYFNKNDITSLTKLLKRIAPQLSYEFVDAQKIYNVYSYSSPSAKAIKKYIHKVLPKYVLFLGDASEKEDENDLIPTHYHIQDKDFTRVETDYAYTYLNDPSNPKLSVGRLPFKSSSELDSYIKKVHSFLDRRKNLGYAIYDDIPVITSNLNVAYTSYEKQNAIKKYLGMNTISSYINAQNPSVFQFIGHASYTGWSKNKKVDIDDMESLNAGNTFLLIDLSCWTGTFAYHKRDCFTENLIKMNNKGAILSISASGYTHIDNYNSITEYFVSERGKTIGLVLKQLKKELFKQNKISLDDLHAYNLIGIPTLTY